MENYDDLGVDLLGTEVVTKNKFGTSSDRVPLMRMSSNGSLVLPTYRTDNNNYMYDIPSGIVV